MVRTDLRCGLCLSILFAVGTWAQAASPVGAPAALTSTAVAGSTNPISLITPTDWLKAQAKPVFREGHTLPPLTRFGWALDFDTRVEFAENWGYCLEWGGYADSAGVEHALSTPDDPAAKCMALAAKDPKKYKLAVICSREMPRNDAVPPETWARDANGRLLSGQAKSQDGTVWTPGMDAVYSPEAPDAVWEEMGRLRAEPLRKIRAVCPIAIVLNGGEYGLGVPGAVQKVWERDPAIVQAKGERSWADYASERKAHAELLIANAVRHAVPDRLLYIYYTAGGVTCRNSWPDWKNWGPSYEDMKPVADLASSEAYYKTFTNTGWTWAGNRGDLLTKVLNARGREIACGQPLSYNWVSGGWPQDKDQTNLTTVSDIGLYMGFLKCWYTAGMIGGNAGAYYYPRPKGAWPVGFGMKFPADRPPIWLDQMVALSRVHALFSHFEAYLRQGDLLPGPDQHRWSKDQPAYEFPTGDPNLRVLVRKLRDQPQWLITAWAGDGKERSAKVTIPELGDVMLLARGNGRVYEATIKDGRPSVLPAADE